MPTYVGSDQASFDIVVSCELQKQFDILLSRFSGCFHFVDHSIGRFTTLNEDWVLIRCQVIILVKKSMESLMNGDSGCIQIGWFKENN